MAARPPQRNAFVCSCHDSIVDPRSAAEVIDGPAPRPLAAPRLKLNDGVVAIASTFSGRVGGRKIRRPESVNAR